MALKHHTIIFVPHARARLRKWRISNLQLSLLVSGFLLATAAGLVVSWFYFTTAIDRDHLEALRFENENLKSVNDSFEVSISGLESKLAEYEDRTRKLAILAGLEVQNIGSEVGIGGPPELPSQFFQAGSGEKDPVGLHQPELGQIEGRLSSLDGTLHEVQERLDERARWISSMPTIAPVRGLTTSSYGVRRDPVHGGRAFHQGIDISAAPGAPVLATAAGIITTSGWSGGLGKAVFISHGYGLATRYAHLSDVTVQEGERVDRGDVIGYVGNTGRSTGYHLHYEVRENGQPTNPMGHILDKNVWRR